MGDVRTPFTVADERETLLAFLDYLREAMVRKVDDLEDEQVRHSPVPTGTSLLGLLKHLTMVEVLWFQLWFAGRDIPAPSNDLEPGDTTESVVAAYRQAITAANDIVAATDSLDQLAAKPGTAPEPLSLRWVLVHMVEETGRHAGHADIVRELIDGQTGR